MKRRKSKSTEKVTMALGTEEEEEEEEDEESVCISKNKPRNPTTTSTTIARACNNGGCLASLSLYFLSLISQLSAATSPVFFTVPPFSKPLSLSV